MIEITIPLEPVAKGRPRIGKWGAYTPSKTRNFEKACSFFLKEHHKLKPISGPLYCKVIFFFAPPKKPKHWLYPVSVRGGDIDNLCKSVLDAANGILWEDDKQIIHLEAFKFYNAKSCIKIFVEDRQ